MKTEFRPVPRVGWLLPAGLLMFCCCPVQAQQAMASNYAKKVMHQDGTSTESVSDTAKRELRETTYDARGVVLTKRIVLLNESGQPVQGVIYDGADNLAGRVQFLYDDLGRPSEERSLNAQGQVFRRKFMLYDASGKPLPSKVVDYAQNAPAIRSGSINFTNVTPAPGQARNTTAAVSGTTKQPGQAPQIMTVSPRSGGATPATPATPPAEEPKKRGFFGFGRK